MSTAAEALDQLLVLQEQFERGPKREGAFATWLLMRVAMDIGLVAAAGDRSDRRRVALLTKRLAPLALARPLARGLAAALAHLQEGSPGAARIALAQLVAPVRESLGPEAAEAVAVGAKVLHEASRSGRG